MSLHLQTHLVIPAKAGIYDLSYRLSKRRLFKRTGRTMDSRLRGNDKCLLVLIFVIVFLFAVTRVEAQGTGPTPELANRQLPDPAQEAIATNLMHSLRCIQCQGQSIADSDAQMAGTMRAEVRQQIASGQEPEAIRQWMVDRYGEWVSFEPEMRGVGLLLWAMPLLVLLLALWLARGLFRRRI
jgi:cytochrome c-type biogenesis protein CcmH/NrfF